MRRFKISASGPSAVAGAVATTSAARAAQAASRTSFHIGLVQLHISFDADTACLGHVEHVLVTPPAEIHNDNLILWQLLSQFHGLVKCMAWFQCWHNAFSA
mmetsp:Transcript_27425/g.53611  ORF Transcript_27425/g.53611 Transcript_27425/m.53611 type:complete len:101 (-) Transcript_27425:948-1250(-)